MKTRPTPNPNWRCPEHLTETQRQGFVHLIGGVSKFLEFSPQPQMGILASGSGTNACPGSIFRTWRSHPNTSRFEMSDSRNTFSHDLSQHLSARSSRFQGQVQTPVQRHPARGAKEAQKASAKAQWIPQWSCCDTYNVETGIVQNMFHLQESVVSSYLKALTSETIQFERTLPLNPSTDLCASLPHPWCVHLRLHLHFCILDLRFRTFGFRILMDFGFWTLSRPMSLYHPLSIFLDEIFMEKLEASLDQNDENTAESDWIQIVGWLGWDAPQSTLPRSTALFKKTQGVVVQKPVGCRWSEMPTLYGCFRK